jgi:two-component system, sensor histidine kinase and response regulator
LTVLVIDDNELHRRMAGSCLERAGHRVVVAGAAAETADLLAAVPANVVLVSAALPDDGCRIALNQALAPRKSLEGVALAPPIVVLAAPPERRAELQPLLARGAAGIVARPYERERLAAHVELYSLGAAPARILVVEDSPTMRHASVDILHEAGHDTVEAADGVLAMAALDADPAIDLVLADVMMPRMDGFQLVEAIRARPDKRGLPVLILTTLDDVGSHSRAIEAGADDVLEKPITPIELCARVRTTLRLKNLQQKLIAKNRELEHALALRQDLTQLIVHDFKNPLSIVMGCGDMIAAHAEEVGQPVIVELANDVVNAAIRLKNFTETLLEVARLEGEAARPMPTVFPIAQVIDAICNDIGRLARRVGVELVCAAPPELKVRADRDWIYRVLQNLVDNALKYAPSSTRVTISAAPANHRFARVAVADQGPGIPPADRVRIFDKFAQMRGAERKGTGLGLAFCRMAVEAHGGHIRIDSGPDGAGTVFAFTLPVA